MGSRTVLSREGRHYRARVCAALAGMRVVRMNGRLEVRVTVCPPDNRRRDLDNVQAVRAVLQPVKQSTPQDLVAAASVYQAIHEQLTIARGRR